MAFATNGMYILDEDFLFVIRGKDAYFTFQIYNYSYPVYIVSIRRKK
jgi:hypothetical protein